MNYAYGKCFRCGTKCENKHCEGCIGRDIESLSDDIRKATGTTPDSIGFASMYDFERFIKLLEVTAKNDNTNRRR